MLELTDYDTGENLKVDPAKVYRVDGASGGGSAIEYRDFKFFVVKEGFDAVVSALEEALSESTYSPKP